MLHPKDLHNYQLAAVDHILNNDFAGLFLDMGLGKTVSTLTALNTLMFEELEISRVLVIAPKRVAESVWDKEVNKWSHLRHLRVSKIIGTEKQRKTALAEKADIYLMGRDNVAWLVGIYGGMMLPFDMVVIDESSSFKNPKSIRFKSLKKAMPSVDRVIILTGTPAPNGLIDLWSQLYLLDRGQRLGKTITRFRDEYFKPDKRNGHIVYSYKPLTDGEERIHKQIDDICMSMKAEDFLDLPGVVENTVEIVFPKALQAKYDEFEKEQVLRLFEEEDDENDISAVNAAALSNKLLQFANGAIYDEDRNVHEVHSLKLDAVEELVEAAQGKPVLIAWAYKHDRDRLLDRLKKYKPRQLSTDKDVDDWNAGKIQVMMMHPASGGHGLNLQDGGNIIVWFGQTWSLELEQQFNARLNRQGQKQIVTINRLVSTNTIDQDVLAAIANKADKQEGLMQAIKAKLKKYAKYRKRC